MSVETTFECETLISGEATGELLVSDVGLSFWGGVDPSTGQVIDQRHPLHTENLGGKILALPSGRGSCSGSGVMLESLLNNVAPAALVFSQPEDILTLGVLVGQVLFDRSIPVYQIDSEGFDSLQSGTIVSIANGTFTINSDPTNISEYQATERSPVSSNDSIKLSAADQLLLDGHFGKAAQLAMQIVVKMAALQGAGQLIDVSQAHIDACVYNGPSSLLFAQRLVSMGGRVRVPTTLNSLSVDQRRWQQQGVEREFGEAASALGDAYMEMGATLSYTCAPYLLGSAPVFGEQIVWAESNAVTFANSIIGARTQKYPDFLDICVALTGRAPMAGTHLDSGRRPTIRIQVSVRDGSQLDDAFWPLLGYHTGTICRNNIPLITGLDDLAPTRDDHKAFSAAFATTSSVPMYHISGHTPEAQDAVAAATTDSVIDVIDVGMSDLLQSWNELNSATTEQVDLICLGNPHFSLTECAALAELTRGRIAHQSTGVIVTLGRDTYEQATEAGYAEVLTEFGVQFVNDTCWCMIEEPVIPPAAEVLMTNSGKYAHYGPGLVNRPVHFGGLAECVDAACSGKRQGSLPIWLQSGD